MTRDRRDRADETPAGPKLAHTILYPLLGSVVGLGSPVGALLLRLALQSPPLPASWIRIELADNAVFYAYMGIDTVGAFAVFGYVLGLRSERQRSRNAALRERVRELHLSSITDGLTGAFSHAYLQEALALELAAARRDGRPLSVLMLDLDDFKAINDTHGHLFGDRVLREVTETIASNIRQADVLARYGGEEFAVLMPGADAETAHRVAERVRLAVSRSPVSDDTTAAPHAASVSVRLSVGAAPWRSEGDGEPAVALLRRAAVRLYAAKRAGKNRTVSATSEIKR